MNELRIGYTFVASVVYECREYSRKLRFEKQQFERRAKKETSPKTQDTPVGRIYLQKWVGADTVGAIMNVFENGDTFLLGLGSSTIINIVRIQNALHQLACR